MDNWLFITIIAALFSVWLLLHYSKVLSERKHNALLHPPRKKTQTFHGVTIHECAGACESVKELHGKRFLAREAVALPVLGCTAKECACTYVHHADRRSGEDRRFPSIAMDGVFSDNEHRTAKSDRRKASFA